LYISRRLTFRFMASFQTLNTIFTKALQLLHSLINVLAFICVLAGFFCAKQAQLNRFIYFERLIPAKKF
jgi:hypothetical protein